MVKGSNTCPYCGIGRNFGLDIKNWSLARVTPSRNVLVGGSHLCVKGRRGYDFALHHPVDAARIGLNGRTRVRVRPRRREVIAEAVVAAPDPPARNPRMQGLCGPG
jgi:predicted molibdopterin-dependent oxidoreductase YjgC